MSFDLGKIIEEMGPFQLSVAAALGLMALAALTVFVERLWVYYRTRGKSARFAHQAAEHMDRGDYAGVESAAGRDKGNLLATMLGAGMRCYRRALSEPSGEVGPVELARRELQRRADTIAAQLRRGLNVLASIGSTAPFVGLLGTVVGIIHSFEGIAAEGSGGLGAVSAGIAEALVVTAFGLVVAIPSVLAFNLLSARADALELAFDQARGQFVDHVEARHGRVEVEPAPEVKASAA